MWIGSLCYKKFVRIFVARSFTLIAPVRPVLHRVSCGNEMVPNTPKHYETCQNMSLGSNGVDRVPPLGKIPTRLCCTIFCINCTSLACFALGFVPWPNGSKCTRILRNTLEHEFKVQWCWSDAFVAKIPTWHRFTNFYIIAPVLPVLH